mgnify:CR=1 FL=1|tara:strand:- start:5071 stop:5283 length:213 start_codon:yes stop_codon:yes gene_type:complete
MINVKETLEQVKESNIISWNCEGRKYDLKEIQNEIDFIVDNDKNLTKKEKINLLDITSEFIDFIERFGED